MRRGTKRILGIAGATFALGMLLSTAGLAMGGRSESLLSLQALDLGGISVEPSGIHIGGKNGIHVTSDGVDIGGTHGIHVGSGGIHVGGNEQEMISVNTQLVEEEKLDNFTSIDIDLSLGDIWLQEGEEPKVSMSWNFDNYTINYRIENDVLKIEDQSWRPKNNREQSCFAKVIIALPVGMELEEIDFCTGLGDINIDAGITAQNASLETDLGDISCIGLTAEWLEAETDLGDVEVVFPQREGVTYVLETDLGEVQVDGKKQGSSSDGGTTDEQYSIYAKSSLGDVSLRFAK